MLSHSPLLRAVNLSIAVLLIAFLAAVYWFAWRPLPETSGEIGAPISAKATIARDAIGIPHIEAATWEDAVFLQGYVTAQDRMWQMDALRRLAAGELAEVVGKAGLESDQEARRLRLAQVADDAARTMPEADRAIVAAYARGVNYYLETHRGRLPLEFTLLNYEPRPWRIRDCVLAGLQMFRTLTTSWKQEVAKMQMLESGDEAKVNFLFPARTGFDPQPGSNSWAVSGSRSATGKPILANDTHLDFGIPSTWYMIHLKAAGLNVTGFTLPGVPAVIIGHNDSIAWGITNLGFDVQDLYEERIDGKTGRYVFQDHLEQARIERGVIAVKGDKPVETVTYITRHGPIFLIDGNHQFALRWTATDPGTFQFPFLDIDRARDWTEFTAALARFPGPGQNFVYADTAGNIGYHATGRNPIRPKGCGGDVPADGASGKCEWTGMIPFDELPGFYNPASGAVVTANNNPFPENYPYPVNGMFSTPDRAIEIRTLLDRRAKWEPQQMLEVQKDVYSAFLHFLARQIVAAADAKKETGFTEALDLLRKWNGQMEKGTAAPMVAALTFTQIRKSMAERASPGGSKIYDYEMAPSVAYKLLTQRPRDWYPDYDQWLLRCLGEAIQEGEKIQGSKVSRWDYGQLNALRMVHPVGGQLPLIGTYFNIGPVPMSGGTTTIKQSTRRLGPSMRMIVDLSDLDHSLENITVGESGHRLSLHYKDQWPAYYGATSFPMQFVKIEAKSTLTVHPGVAVP